MPTNPEKGRSGKPKTKNAGHQSDASTGARNICLLHVPGQSSEECKVIKINCEKYAAQRPHKPIEARFGGKPKRGKAVEFNDNTQ